MQLTLRTVIVVSSALKQKPGVKLPEFYIEHCATVDKQAERLLNV
jgi:hypothetical protein